MKTPWGYLILGLAGAGLALWRESMVDNGHAAFGLVLLGMAWLAGCAWVGHIRAQRHRLSLGREGGKVPPEAPEGADGGGTGEPGAGRQ